MLRIFIAINLPEEVKTELERIKQGIIDAFPENIGRGVAKWVKKENLHVTVLFIGETREEEIPKLVEALKETAQAHRPFTLTFNKVCYGPFKKLPPRLIWLELDQNPTLTQLAMVIKAKALEAGVLKRVDSRPFSGHITLARVKAWAWKQIDPTEQPDIEQELDLSFEVKSIDLMESKLSPTGAKYSVLQSIPLT